jgi:hypothetical protein
VKSAAQHYFKTFPEFSKLTLADRDAFLDATKNFSPSYDLSLYGLMTWWNILGTAAVAQHNGNLVIPYYIPGDDDNAGLALVGKTEVDESICAIFDYLKGQHRPVRLVNVPEFVLSNIRYHDMFTFTDQRDYFDYVLPLSHFYPLKNMAPHWSHKVKKLLAKYPRSSLEVKSLDLDIPSQKAELLAAARIWRTKNKINDYGLVEADCMNYAIKNAGKLGIENLCLFVEGKLWGFCLYEVCDDQKTLIMNHIKATHPSTFGFEFISYMFAERLVSQGYECANFGADHGIEPLRMFMLTLGASNFCRKYIIEPRGHINDPK